MEAASKLDLKEVNQTSWTEAGFPGKLRHLWICYNFSVNSFLTSPFIESAVFEDDHGSSWKLRLCSVCDQREPYGVCLVSVARKPNSTVDFDGAVSFDFVDDKGNMLSVGKPMKLRISGGNNQVVVLQKYKLNEPLTKWVREDNLHILLHLWRTLAVNSGIGRKPQTVKVKPQTTLASDFKNLFENSSLSDITICTGDTKFGAHKAVLAARSQVFRAMLEAPMKESETNCVRLDTFSPEVVNGMLKYLYSEDTTVVTPELAQEFVEISNLYVLDGLKFEAEAVLGANLKAENAIENFQKAVLFKCEMLKSKTIDFIVRNKILIEKNQVIKDLAKTNLEDVLELQKHIWKST